MPRSRRPTSSPTPGAYGCVLVAASGNSGRAERYYPAALPEVIAVGSAGGRRHALELLELRRPRRAVAHPASTSSAAASTDCARGAGRRTRPLRHRRGGARSSRVRAGVAARSTPERGARPARLDSATPLPGAPAGRGRCRPARSPRPRCAGSTRRPRRDTHLRRTRARTTGAAAHRVAPSPDPREARMTRPASCRTRADRKDRQMANNLNFEFDQRESPRQPEDAGGPARVRATPSSRR